MRITSHPLRGAAAAEAVRNSRALDKRFRTHLRLVEPSDAAFIESFQPARSADLTERHRWIRRYQAREADGTEFYFVLVSDDRRRGLVRMHDFTEIAGEPSFGWGNWVIQPPCAPDLVAFCALMIYELGFDRLGYARAHIAVARSNPGLAAFHEDTSAALEFEDGDNLYYRFQLDDYDRFQAELGPVARSHRAVEMPEYA